MMHIFSLISTLQKNIGLKLMMYFNDLKTHSQNKTQLTEIAICVDKGNEVFLR